MKKYIVRMRLVLLLSIIISFLFTYFGVYMPLVSEVENKAVSQFKAIAMAKTNAFKETIDKNVQAAAGLSSRSVIRDRIAAYQKGETTMEELSAFTEDKYKDGAKIIENLTYAKRIVEDQVVTVFYSDNHVGVEIPYLSDVSSLEYHYNQKGVMACLDVISPIFINDVVVGHDLVGFCLNETLIELNDDQSILIKLSRDLPVLAPYDFDLDLSESETHLYYVYGLDDDNYMLVSQDKADLFQSRNNLTKLVILNMGLAYGLILLLIYIFIFRYAQSRMEDLTQDRDTYRKKADFDLLTGANTRLFLERFIENHPYEKGILILIDLDNFKEINDTRGHLVGDEVLKATVETIKGSIRSEDMIIRYGGDEFLIIIRSHTLAEGEHVVTRISEKLTNWPAFDFEIDFSYGIIEVESMQSLNKHINEADMKMYLNKMDKRIKASEK